MKDLYVGAVCVWYAHADVHQRPAVGIVTAIKAPGVLTMYKFPASGGLPRMMDNVHHVDSQRLRENQNIRLEYGGWYTVEAADKRRTDEIAAQKQRHMPTVVAPSEVTQSPADTELGEDQKKILSYYEEGMTVDEIAEKMGRGWGPKKVSSALKETVKSTA